MNEWLPRNLHERIIVLNHPFNFNDPTENNFSIRGYSKKVSSDKFLNSIFESLYDKKFFSNWAGNENEILRKNIENKLSKDFIKNMFVNDLLEKKEAAKKFSENKKAVLKAPTDLKVENLDELEGWEDEFIYKAIKKAQESYRIASFTDNWHNSLMWGHYADGMRGVCVKYEIDDRDIHEVDYGKPYEVSTYNMLNGKVEQEVERTFLKKNQDWSYESEFRIIKRESFYKLKKGAVKAVFFGYKCDPGKARFLCDIVKAAHGPNVNFYVARNSQVDHTVTHDKVKSEGLSIRISQVKDEMRKFRTFLDDSNVAYFMDMLGE
ncbi:DUF2971 domain-containing protein [Halomonas maura]|uniref:DUF2971 domain-containing protein n=1 Tax=Halomonas maura TaxID=117606 RepID=UPI0025B4DB22|nr:DUF2971 domain-containing protein [Halomonas maura]MDN3554479.1 DUF2971 domain-containing protein [Halomonas maura]